MAIEVTYDDRTYKFGITRSAATMLEQDGFDLEQVASKPNLMIPKLVYCAAVAYNPGIRRKLVDDIFDALDAKDDFIVALIEEYGAATASLMETKDQGKATWKQV